MLFLFMPFAVTGYAECHDIAAFLYAARGFSSYAEALAAFAALRAGGVATPTPFTFPASSSHHLLIPPLTHLTPFHSIPFHSYDDITAPRDAPP